jgi:hypothetical protein
MGPGHALFESVLHQVMVRFRDDLERGAIFTDPDGKREGLIWLIEGTVNDGLGAVVGQQLFAVYQPTNGGPMETLPPSIFLDFAVDDTRPNVPSGMKGLLEEKGKVVGWSLNQQLAHYCQQIAARRAREMEIIRRYLRESFDVLIARSDGMLMDYEHKQSTGKDMRIKIAEEDRRNQDLRRRKDERLARAEREAMIMLAEPKIVGVAAVLSEKSARQGTSMRRDDEVEQAAVEAVMAYERQRGRNPEDLSAQKLPYDVRSTGEGQEIRYIEVKGRAGTGEVELSEREWLTAENLGEDYWLYIVTEVIQNPNIAVIRNPVRTLAPQHVQERTRYHVTETGWRQAAERE